MTAFSELDLNPALIAGVAAQGFDQMTPVQAQSLPPMLDGRDVLAQAQTGSGKTAAFGLALLQRLVVAQANTQALVLCPTRELADQVTRAIRALASQTPNVKLLTLCGGVPVRTQVASLEHAPHIVVGTPGRVLALLKRESLDSAAIETLVLDEGDRMLDMGFGEEIDAVIARLPARRHTWLFSATWPDGVRDVSARLQNDPVSVHVAEHVDNAPAIAQRFFKVDARAKLGVLMAMLARRKRDDEDSDTRTLVFCNTRVDVDTVTEALRRKSVDALSLHGDREQRERDEMLIRFANGSCTVLVATDVAARGLDITGLPRVINYDLARDEDTHTHRIGRTGRAGQPGLAITLCLPAEADRGQRIMAFADTTLTWDRAPKDEGRSIAAAPMTTLLIEGGRRDKLRPGDLLGALTGDVGLSADDVGKIDIGTVRSYVAIRRRLVTQAATGLNSAGIKKRRFRVRLLR